MILNTILTGKPPRKQQYNFHLGWDTSKLEDPRWGFSPWSTSKQWCFFPISEKQSPGLHHLSFLSVSHIYAHTHTFFLMCDCNHSADFYCNRSQRVWGHCSYYGYIVLSQEISYFVCVFWRCGFMILSSLSELPTLHFYLNHRVNHPYQLVKSATTTPTMPQKNRRPPKKITVLWFQSSWIYYNKVSGK